MKINKRNKLIAIVSLIILLFTNYCVFADTAIISYVRTGGNKVSSIARVIDGNYYLEGNYNAKSVETSRYNEEGSIQIVFYQYKSNKTGSVWYSTLASEELQTARRYVYESSIACSSYYNYDPERIAGFYFSDTSPSAEDSMRTLKFGWRLPAGDVHVENVGTIVSSEALIYNGQTYRIDLNIKEINKTGTSPIVLATRVGKKTTKEYSMDQRDYTIGTFPTLSAEPAEEGQRDFKMEVKVEFSIHKEQAIQDNYDEDLVSVSGVWGVEDIDGNEGLVIHDYKAKNGNTFVTKKLKAEYDEYDELSDENLMYKLVNNDKDTYIFSKTDEYTDNANAYFKMDDVSTINLTQTWDGKTGGTLFKFRDDVIQSYNKIITKVTPEGEATITPSITDIKKSDNRTETITYSPKDATRQYLASILVDGDRAYLHPSNDLNIPNIEHSYTFKNIQEDHTIEVTYENKHVVTFKANGGQPTPEKQYKAPYELAEEPAKAPERTGYDFSDWTLDNAHYDFSKPVTKDITLVAKWTPKKYSITYDLNGGSIDPGLNPDEYTINDHVIFKSPQKANCTFLGWEDCDKNSPDFGKIIVEIPAESTGARSFKAKWSDDEFSYDIAHYIQKNGQYPEEANQTLPGGTGKIGETKIASPLQSILDQGYEQDTDKIAEATGPIPETGKLTLKVYYKPREWTITYHGDEGYHDSINPEKYKTGENKTIANALERDGYNFLGYYEDEALTPSKRITSTAGKAENLDLYASWQKIDESSGGYAIAKYYVKKNGNYVEQTNLQERLDGKVNDKVSANILTIKGYRVNKNAKGYKEDGTIQANAVEELRIYYDPNEYHIKYELNGRSEDILTNKTAYPETYTVDSNVTFSEPQWSGYNFEGWYEDNTTFNKKITSTTGKAEDITIYAKWNNEGTTQGGYRIEYYLENNNGNYEIDNTKTVQGTGNIDETKTAPILTIKGYDVNKGANGYKESGKITSDSTLVLKIYYKLHEYHIKYETSGRSEDILANKTAYPETYTVKNNVTFTEPKWTGHIFEGWYEDNTTFKKKIASTEGKAEDITIYAKWNEVGPVKYTVEHYKKTQQDKYELHTRDTSKSGTIGREVEATPISISGYEINENLGKKKDEIEADGSLVLQLYYDPVEYKIEYTANEGTNASENPQSYTINDRKEIEPATREGYIFKGWYENEKFTGTPIVLIENRTGDIHLYAKWEGKPVDYKIEHYLEDQYGEYDLLLTRENEEKNGTIVTAEPLELRGYKLNEKLGNTSEMIAEDGSSVLKLYYNKAKYTVTFDSQNGEEISNQTISYLDVAKVQEAPERKGYEFEYWYYIDKNGNEVEYDFDTTKVTSDIHLIAKYTPLEDNTTTSSAIPQTGWGNGFMVFAIIGLLTLTGAFGFKYFKFKKI